MGKFLLTVIVSFGLTVFGLMGLYYGFRWLLRKAKKTISIFYPQVKAQLRVEFYHDCYAEIERGMPLFIPQRVRMSIWGPFTAPDDPNWRPHDYEFEFQSSEFVIKPSGDYYMAIRFKALHAGMIASISPDSFLSKLEQSGWTIIETNVKRYPE